ncbi:MAG: hypothetical protein ACI3YL_07115 [Prevotella sp.]|nr:hypothetical protein [Prevotella sp.]MCI5854342.1 hypothetical protein [Prevotella sp.]MDD6737750.1 hypothetical protein [Prevotella sp.]MDY6091953.1 hypothetical protein [Prevotella sp.]
MNIQMIKRTLFLSFFLCCITLCQAQEVYLEVLRNARTLATDSKTNPTIRQIAQFKQDALDYMLVKMREVMPDSSTIFLDKQAMALNTFVNFYTKSIIEATEMPDAYQVEIQKCFMDASYSNPLFNDPEEDITLAYFAKGDCLTRFSLDTDWRKANIAAMKGMEQLKSKIK